MSLMKLGAHSVIDRLNICLGSVHLHVNEDGHSHAHEVDDHAGSNHTHDQSLRHAHHFHPPFQKDSSAITQSAIVTLVEISETLAELWKKPDAKREDIARKIEELLRAIDRSKDADVLSILSDSRIGQIQPLLWDIMSTIEYQNELREAREFVMKEKLSMDQVLQYSFGGDYERLIEKEITCLLNVFPELKKQIEMRSFEILFIGAGPMPMSAIYIHKLVKCKVKCIDRDPEAVAVGKTLVSMLDLSHDLQYECISSSLDIQVSPNTVLFVASLVQGKLDVLKRIPPNVSDRVVCQCLG